MYLSILLVPLGGLLWMDLPQPVEVNALRKVSYYNSRFYPGAEHPFMVSPPEILLEGMITQEGIMAALAEPNLVIEVCRFEQREAGEPSHTPQALEDRHRSCEIYGPLVTKRQP